jgi:murein DD-endopeptidase MepM/ murein hydrolase activator NlpD
MPAPVDIKKWGLSAGEYYSSGAYHGAFDIACPTGTVIHAAMPGRVIGCNRGVPKNQTGGSGSPSNWVLIYTAPFPGFPHGVTTYYQHLWHLAPIVKVGAHIPVGEKIATSDNTGNSSGPHLHLHVMKGKQDRYALYADHSLAVYPPSKAWHAWDAHHAAVVNAAKAKPNPSVPAPHSRSYKTNPVRPGEHSGSVVQIKKWLKWPNKTNYYGAPLVRRVKRFQKKHGLGVPNGVIGPKTWAALKSGKR